MPANVLGRASTRIACNKTVLFSVTLSSEMSLSFPTTLEDRQLSLAFSLVRTAAKRQVRRLIVALEGTFQDNGLPCGL